MQLLCVLIVLIFAATNFVPTSTGNCRLSSYYKNITCSGYRFRQMVVGKSDRERMKTVNLFDCKEPEVKEEALNYPNLEVLILNCDIEKIHVNGFRNLRHLRELDLGNNSISTLVDNTFQSLGELRKLNLNHNDLEEVSRNMFNGLNNLKQLYLSYNSISKFDIKAFDAIKSVEELSLDNNKLGAVPGRVLRKLSKLQRLDLSYNSIEDVGELFTFTYTIEHLNLSHNLLAELPKQMFQLTNLKVLDVSNNELSVVYESALKLNTLEALHLQNNKISLFEVQGIGLNRIPLQYLDLRNNRLVFLEDNFIKIAKYLVTFKIEANPWDCKCYNKMAILRGDLSFDVSSAYADGELPLCILGPSGGDECDVDRTNLEYYYNVLQEQLDA